MFSKYQILQFDWLLLMPGHVSKLLTPLQGDLVWFKYHAEEVPLRKPVVLGMCAMQGSGMRMGQL